MRQVCYVCGILYGIKEPLNDDSETHGICPECLPGELQKIEHEVTKLNNGRLPGKLE